MEVQAYLGGVTRSDPDHCNKANITVKQDMNFGVSHCI